MNIHFKARIHFLCAHFVPEKFSICSHVMAVPPRHVLRLSEFLATQLAYFLPWQVEEVMSRGLVGGLPRECEEGEGCFPGHELLGSPLAAGCCRRGGRGRKCFPGALPEMRHHLTKVGEVWFTSVSVPVLF